MIGIFPESLVMKFIRKNGVFLHSKVNIILNMYNKFMPLVNNMKLANFLVLNQLRNIEKMVIISSILD